MSWSFVCAACRASTRHSSLVVRNCRPTTIRANSTQRTAPASKNDAKRSLEFFRRRVGASPKTSRTYRGPLSSVNAEESVPPDIVKPNTAKLRMTYKGNEFLEERLKDFLMRLNRVQVSGNRRLAQSLWDEINRYRLGISPLANMPRNQVRQDGPDYKNIPAELYQKLLETASALRLESLTSYVWEDMIQCGVEPSVKMWHARLHGHCRLRDPIGLEKTWNDMLSSGVQPDVFCWVARVRGLISSREWTNGISALNEMGTSWEAAAKHHLGVRPQDHVQPEEYAKLGDVGGIPKPNAVTLNAALQELSAMKRRSYYNDLVRWAARLGVKWDTQTYNILIKPCLAHNDIGRAITLLKEMEAEELQPDSATYTMFLQTALANPGYFGETEPFAAASKVLSSMKDAVVEASIVTYGTLIHHIIDLRSPQPMTSEEIRERRVQAEAVLNHMRRSGIVISSTIYMTMASSYLDPRSPDIPAFDRLWSELAERNFEPDYIFFDRVIIAFANLNDPDRALLFFKEAKAQGKPSGWRALAAVGRALVRNENDEKLASFVKDVINDDLTNSINTVRMPKERELFFSFVQDCVRENILPSDILN